MPYAIVDAVGRVWQVGTGGAPEPMEGRELIPDAQGASLAHYWDGEGFVPIEPQPSPWHSYDWPTHTWIDSRTLADLAAAKWVQIKAERDRQESAGFPYLGRWLDSDSLSVQRISAAALAGLAALAAGASLSIEWTCADNSVLTLDAQQLAAMPTALAAHADVLHQISRDLRAQIDAATTAEALELIQWPIEET